MIKKKLFAVLLCFSMLFSFTAPAFAATNIPDKQLSSDLETKDSARENVGFAPALAGVYLIPGVGEVAIAATGAIVIAGVTIAVGNWIYTTVVNWVESYGKAQIAEASKNVSSQLKDSTGNVDLSKFNNKKPGNGPPTYLGPLGWYIQKDMAGHGGRAWKLFDKAGSRIASLASDGKILGK